MYTCCEGARYGGSPYNPTYYGQLDSVSGVLNGQQAANYIGKALFGSQVMYMNADFQLVTPEGGTDVSVNLAVETQRVMGIPLLNRGFQFSVTQPNNSLTAPEAQGGLKGAQYGMAANIGVMNGTLADFTGVATQVSGDVGVLGATMFRAGESQGSLMDNTKSIIGALLSLESGSGVDVGVGTGIGLGGSHGEVQTYEGITFMFDKTDK